MDRGRGGLALLERTDRAKGFRDDDGGGIDSRVRGAYP
jgi:hypothetical protein